MNKEEVRYQYGLKRSGEFVAIFAFGLLAPMIFWGAICIYFDVIFVAIFVAPMTSYFLCKYLSHRALRRFEKEEMSK